MSYNRNLHKKKSPARLDPALRAALILLLPSVLVRILASWFTYSWVGMLLQITLYITCGYMAAEAYFESIRREFPRGRPKESVRSGAKAGITLGILFSVLIVLLMLLLNWLVPIGVSISALQPGFVFLIPLDVIGGLLLGALGGKMSASTRR